MPSGCLVHKQQPVRDDYTLKAYVRVPDGAQKGPGALRAQCNTMRHGKAKQCMAWQRVAGTLCMTLETAVKASSAESCSMMAMRRNYSQLQASFHMPALRRALACIRCQAVIRLSRWALQSHLQEMLRIAKHFRLADLQPLPTSAGNSLIRNSQSSQTQKCLPQLCMRR